MDIKPLLSSLLSSPLSLPWAGLRAGRLERADGQPGGPDEAAERHHRLGVLTAEQRRDAM